MWSVIIVHILGSIFVFIEVQLVSYVICVNVLMIIEVVSISLYNSFESHTKTFYNFLHFFEELASKIFAWTLFMCVPSPFTV